VQAYIVVDKRPPAPYAVINLYSPDIVVFGEVQCSCRGLLDTASESTYIPDFLLKDTLGLSPSGELEESVGVGGPASYYPFIVKLGLSIGEARNILSKNIKVLGWERTTALIGRNVLDRLHICFDGDCFYLR
jgi:hypothetical protein